MKCTLLFSGLACLAVILTGCGRSRPLLRPPGPIDQQRYGASLHDPYTDNDAGPIVDGGRPREFEKPLAEPVRNRWLRDNWWTQ